MAMTTRPTTIGSEPSSPARDALPPAGAGSTASGLGPGRRRRRRVRRLDGVGAALAVDVLDRSPRRPSRERASSLPAVIACTTSCWLVSDVVNMPTSCPSRSTEIRSATSKMSCRLCETITTPRSRSARRRTRSRTWRVCATPRAAVGSSRITTFEFHMTDFATATAWRWPPESPATSWRTDCRVVTDRLSSVSAEAFSMLRLVEHEAVRAARGPRNMLATTSRLSASARSWYTISMPEPGGVARPVDVHRLALEADLALVERIDAGDALDQGRLAGSVVADEGHDLAGRGPRSRPGRAPERPRTPWRRPGTRGGVRQPWRHRPSSLTSASGDARGRSPLASVDSVSRSVTRSPCRIGLGDVAGADLLDVRNPSAITVSAMLSTVTPIGHEAKYGTTRRPRPSRPLSRLRR